MVEVDPRTVTVRSARQADVPEIQQLFEVCWGERYSHPKFVSAAYRRKMMYSDNSIALVADQAGEGVIATASVVIDVGAYADLIGEFGRLVVHPDKRGQYIGHQLMTERIERVAPYLHIGFADNRVAHTRSQRIRFLMALRPLGSCRRRGSDKG